MSSADATVTSVGPGRRLAFAGGEGTTVRGYRLVEEAPNGERFVQGLEIRLSGPMRLLEPLLARLHACRMRLEARALKALLERQDRSGDTTSRSRGRAPLSNPSPPQGIRRYDEG